MPGPIFFPSLSSLQPGDDEKIDMHEKTETEDEDDNNRTLDNVSTDKSI